MWRTSTPLEFSEASISVGLVFEWRSCGRWRTSTPLKFSEASISVGLVFEWRSCGRWRTSTPLEHFKESCKLLFLQRYNQRLYFKESWVPATIPPCSSRAASRARRSCLPLFARRLAADTLSIKASPICFYTMTRYEFEILWDVRIDEKGLLFNKWKVMRQ